MAPYVRSVPTAVTGLTPKTTIRSGVMSEPPPIPVRPTSMPTPNPKRTMNGSIRERTLAVQPALRLVQFRPAAVASLRRERAVRAADRLVAAIVQRVVRHVVLVDVGPHLRLAPVGERIRLPQAVPLVEGELRREAARVRLRAAQPGDPAVHVLERARQRRDLADAAAGVRVRLPQLRPEALLLLGEREPAVDVDLEVVALLERTLGLVRLVEQQVGVEREEARRRLDPEQHVHDHRRLLLERAGDVEPRVEAIDDVLEGLLRAGAIEVRVRYHRHG